MTKEELEKEVKEYISYNPTEGSKDFVVYKVRVGENAFVYVVEHKNELSMSDWIKMYEGTERECYRVVGYLDSAEPREKRIAELEAQIERLKGDLELWESGACRTTNLDKCGVVKELEAQIEKMKRCEICKHYRWNHCSYETNISADCIQNKLKHFELREIKEK